LEVSLLNLRRTHVREVVQHRGWEMSSEKDGIILGLFLGDCDVPALVGKILLWGCLPAPNQLPQLDYLLEMIRMTPSSGEELGE